jgi:hypothetical protein
LPLPYFLHEEHSFHVLSCGAACAYKYEQATDYTESYKRIERPALEIKPLEGYHHKKFHQQHERAKRDACAAENKEFSAL